jgi:hypothetical protein
VDGISDQSMALWDSGFADGRFAAYFAERWVADGHIAYARYVVQWDVMQEPTAGANPGGDYRERLEAWYLDASSLGLKLDVALTSYDGSTPADAARYAEQLDRLLDALPGVAYVEAWNEPNGSPYLAPRSSARLANAAEAICRERRTCTVIVGDLLDSSNEVSYERRYERYLDPPEPTDWGIHPYYAVRQLSEATVDAFKASLPAGGAGIDMWFTEVGAYYCSDYGAKLEQAGEERQEVDAYWLTHLLMPNTHPAHVFYFEFLYGEDQPPPCNPAQADTALYVPGGERGDAPRARAAAAMILGGEASPSGYVPQPAGAVATLGSSALAFLPF